MYSHLINLIIQLNLFAKYKAVSVDVFNLFLISISNVFVNILSKIIAKSIKSVNYVQSVFIS